MTIPVHINIQWDPTMGLCSHHYMLPVPVVPSIEMIATQMWFPGFYLEQNKLTTDIKHKNQVIVLEEHDIGAFIFDITIPLPNSWYAIMWPFSSRKIMFTTSIVKMNDKKVGCSQVGLLPLPMMTCGDPVSLPTAFPIANRWNTVKVGMTLFNLFMGILNIALSIAIDLIFNKLGSEPAKLIKQKTAKKILQSTTKGVIKEELVKGVIGKLIPTDKLSIAKSITSSLSGLVTSRLSGNPTLKFKVGGGIVPEPTFQVGGDKKDAGFSIGNTPF